ncbi:MAG TPA: nucleotidyltransferase family protein [Devosia sp.]|nr:nucleotidyltransferase family protein [Devosia sp.]
MSRIAALLLAAGLSRRYGPEDKLAAPFAGRPLAAHAAETLAGLPLAEKYAVCASEEGLVPAMLRASGFAILLNPAPEDGQGSSLAIGATYAASRNLDGLLVALADMPLVPRAHFEAMLARFGAAPGPIASTDGAYRGPPALFPRALFPALIGMTGDAGARRLLAAASFIEATPRELMDFDTPADFGRAAAVPPGASLD